MVWLIVAAVLIRVLLKNDEKKGRPPPTRTGPLLDLKGPQIAGRACAVCNGNITFHTHGRYCDHCEQPMHHECLARHQTDTQGPYR